ncbi:cellulase/esterase CelE-like [Mytilus trossulus]|uniref:cellulase/esterase CelE-like n=1 Tax=Mytilus trossulus TaxID=6551 RepID=UPI003005F16F
MFQIHPKMMTILVLVIICAFCLKDSLARHNPYTPTKYQKKIAQGFSTNFFKTLNFKKYNKKNLADIYERGFRNVRLRCRADLDNLNMAVFLDNLETVVNDCLATNIAPIISWIHHEAEAFATELHRTNYLKWWRRVAEKLKDKDYRLSFNLFTELGVDSCENECAQSLRENTAKYNDWTSAVVKRIRKSGGKNDKRMLILGSPKKTAKGLEEIDQNIYKNDPYMMAEWHIYASGPNKKLTNDGNPGQKYWSGTGDDFGKSNVMTAIGYANYFTSFYNLTTYLGAWMPQANEFGDLSQSEIINFGKYFVQVIKPIPWSMNVLDTYYDTRNSDWILNDQVIKGQTLNMSRVLDEIITVM